MTRFVADEESRRVLRDALVSAMTEVGATASDREHIFRLILVCNSILKRVAPAERGRILQYPGTASADGTMERLRKDAAEGSELRKRAELFRELEVASIAEVERVERLLLTLRRAMPGRINMREQYWLVLVSFAMGEKSESRRERFGERSFQWKGERVGEDKPLNYSASYRRRDRAIAKIVETYKEAFDEARRLAFST